MPRLGRARPQLKYPRLGRTTSATSVAVSLTDTVTTGAFGTGPFGSMSFGTGGGEGLFIGFPWVGSAVWSGGDTWPGPDGSSVAATLTDTGTGSDTIRVGIALTGETGTGADSISVHVAVFLAESAFGFDSMPDRTTPHTLTTATLGSNGVSDSLLTGPTPGVATPGSNGTSDSLLTTPGPNIATLGSNGGSDSNIQLNY